MPGKEGKKKASSRKGLVDDINADRFAAAKKRAPAAEEKDDEESFLLPNKVSNKIMRVARMQLLEEDGQGVRGEAVMDLEDEGNAELENKEEVYDERYDDMDDDDEELVELEYDDQESVATTDIGDYDDNIDEAAFGLSEEEARLLQKFQPERPMQSRNLADIIAEKILEKEKEQRGRKREGGEEEGSVGESKPRIDRRISRVYVAIGHVLKSYTSGKIPKAFKVLPHIQNWEELLMLTNPHEWSPHATYKATRIFATAFNELMAQRFYATILLPIVMDKISQEKKLHPAIYMALRKALFKPVAFFKGFLIPLVQDDECTLRMALVVASILQKSHLPPIPTAVAIVKITQLPFRGPNVVILRILVDKKMTLPYQAIDALVRYFHRFTITHKSKEDILPVLWHQTFLCFVSRYKADLTHEQIQLLRDVCSTHFHHLITPETRRELAIAAKALEAGQKQ